MSENDTDQSKDPVAYICEEHVHNGKDDYGWQEEVYKKDPRRFAGKEVRNVRPLVERDADPTDTGNQKGWEVVDISRGPDVIDEGDSCDRCSSGRSPGESSWLIVYENGEIEDVCSACRQKAEVGTVFPKKTLCDGGIVEDGTDRITKEQAADQGICYYVNDGCESDAVVLLHGRFPLCGKHYRKVIEA